MPKVCAMRELLMAATALMITLPALAEADDFSRAQAVKNWTGCVDQPGFDLYPVRLKATKMGFEVDYPGLCSGKHSLIGAMSSTRALEVITQNTESCIATLPVSYTLDNRKLSLEYTYQGSPLAIAILRPGTKIATCAPSKAIS